MEVEHESPTGNKDTSAGPDYIDVASRQPGAAAYLPACSRLLAGYLLGKAAVPKHAIITAVAGTPTTTLQAFLEAVKVRRGRAGGTLDTPWMP